MPKKIFILLFLVNAFLLFFRSGFDKIGGDEVAAYVSILPFIHGLAVGKIIPTFLVFFHEPIFQIVQLPMVFLGASQFFVRLPNIAFGILEYLVLFRIGRLLFKNQDRYVLILLLLYVFNGYFRTLRAELNHGLFNLVVSCAVYFFIRFNQERKVKDFYKSFQVLLVSLFVYIDAVFIIIGASIFWVTLKLKNKKLFDRTLLVSGLIAGALMTGWGLAVYFASTSSGLFDWRGQAPFSLFARGTAYSFSAISDNVNLFLANNSIGYVLVLVFSVLVSVLDKKSRPLWFLFIPPLVYFNLVKKPTVHMFNFLELILVLAVIGVKVLITRFPRFEVAILLFVVLGLIGNARMITFNNPLDTDRDYLIAVTTVRTFTNPCERIYTNIDGYTFRFFFNHPYTTNMAEDITYAVIEGEANTSLPGFSELARVNTPRLVPIRIYFRSYADRVLGLTRINRDLFTFNNTMTYLTACPR